MGPFDEISVPANQSREWPVLPPMPAVFTPHGEMLACQTARGPAELINPAENKILLPDTVKPINSGLKYKSPILRVIAVGSEVKDYKAGDYVILAHGVQVLEAHQAGYTQIVIHQKGLIGKVNPKYWDQEWKDAVKPIKLADMEPAKSMADGMIDTSDKGAA